MESFWKAVLGTARASPISQVTSPKDRNSALIFQVALCWSMWHQSFTIHHLLLRASVPVGQSGLEIEWTISGMNNSQVLSCMFFLKLDMNIMMNSYATLAPTHPGCGLSFCLVRLLYTSYWLRSEWAAIFVIRLTVLVSMCLC